MTIRHIFIWSVGLNAESNRLNKYPVATNELAEGLQASSAALVAANNSIEEQVAMLAAGNATMQDVSTVAAGLKIVAARLRGTTSDVDDEADSAVTNVSKLQAKIKALTAEANGGEGIDIINENGEYKSTYEILKEISKIFDKMDDVSSASLLELIAGKNRSSIVAAILQNTEILEGAYTDALDSAGSAVHELDTYLNSIQGRIDQFTNATQTMWMNFISSDAVKFIVDIGTQLMKLFDKIGFLGKLFTAVFAGKLLTSLKKIENFHPIKSLFDFALDPAGKINNITKSVEGLATSMQKLSSMYSIQNIFEIFKKPTATGGTVGTIDFMAELAGYDDLADKLPEIAKLLDGTTVLTEKQAIAFVQNQLAALGLNEELQATILANLGLSAAEGTTTVTTIGFSAAIKGLATSFLTLLKAALPFIATLALLGVAIYGVVKIADALIYTHKEATEDLQNTTTEISNLTSELESLNDELSTTKDRIEELENKGPLTLTEQEELDNLKKQNAELERQIQLEEYRLKIEQQKQATNAISAMNTDGNISGIDPSESMYVQIARLITGKTGIESDIDDLEKINNKVVKAQQALYDADSKGIDKSSKEYQSLLDDLTSAEESLAKKQQEIESTFKSANDDYLSTPYFEGDNLTEDQKTWNQYKSWAEDQEDRIQVILGEVGAKNNALNRILGENGTDAAKSFMDAFQNQVDDGQININTSKFENSQAAIDSVTDSVESLMANNPEFKAQLDYIGISAEELARHLMDIHEGISATNEAINIAVTDLTSLKSAYDEYASVLQLVNEATFDGQAISEDMYESLKSYLNDVTVGEEDFSDAIDVTNGKVIKNTKLLRSLISQKKKEQKVTIAAARAQTQLQYTKLVKQLRTAIKAMAFDYKAYGYVTQATYKNIDALRDQIKTIQQAIKQYTLLELKMSDMTNAYENFETAKELDAELTYGDSWFEAIEATSNGFITGQVSTETFKAAIDLLVPEEAYEGLEDYQDQLIAMHDYIDKNPLFANWFTIDDGNFSIEFSNIQKFVEDMLGAGVFTGDVTAFDFSAGVESMDDIVRLTKEYNGGIGVTKETLVAMFTELSKYDGRWGDILSELLMTAPERAYSQTITALDIAIAKQEQFFREGKNPDGADATEYQSILQEITDCSLAATKAKEELVSSTSAWMTANDNLDTAKQKVEKLKQDLQSLDPNENAAEIKVKTEELTQAQQEVAQCQASLDGLEEPTQVGIQLTLNDVNDQIEQWKKENQYLAVEVIPKLEKDENGELKIPATIEATLTDEEKAKLQEGIALYNTQNKYGEVLESDPIVSGLSQLNETVSGIFDIISKDDKNRMASSSADESQESSINVYEDKFGATLGPIFESIANSPSVEYFKDVLSGLDDLSNFLGDGFVDIKNNFVNEWSNIFAETGKNITDFLQWAEEFNFTEDVVQPIRDKFTELNDGFNTWADEYINKPFDDMIQSINAWAEEFSLSEDVVQPIKEKLKEAQDSLVNWVGEHIGAPLSNLVQKINAWAEEFSFSDDVIAPIKERLQNSSNEIIQWFVTDFAYNLGNFVGNIDAFIEDPAGYLQENLVPILRNICKQVDDWLDINVTEPLENIVKKINKFIDDFSFSEDVVKPIKEKFNAINQDFNDWIDEKISKPLGEIVDKINKWAEEFSVKEDVINPIKDKYKEISSVINNWLNEHISEPLSRAVQNLNDWAAEFSFKEDVLIPIQQRLTSFVKGIIDSANAWLDEHISEPAYEIVAHINQFCVDFPNKFHTAIGTIDTWLDEHIFEPIDNIKEDINTFFTNLPGKLSELWDNTWTWFVEKVNIFKLNWNAGYEEANPSKSGESGGSGATGIGQARVTGNARAKGNKTLLAEVGTEMVVDPNRGIYYTVGENGPEMVNLPHGAIVFNHKQTKDLLENGHTGARGKITDSAALNQALGGSALATGNAYPLGNGTAAHGLFGGYVYLNDTGVAYKNDTDYYDVNADWGAAADALSGAADDLSDAADDFEDTINWIEVLFNRIDNIISEQELLLELQVDNVAAKELKKENYDAIFGAYNTKYYKSLEASKYYYNKAMAAMAQIPAEYAEKIKNGTIKLEDFAGEENEALVEKINKATEYYDSYQTYTIQAYQTIADIQAKAKEQFDDVQNAYDNERGLNERFLDRVDAMNSLTENIKGFGAKTYLEQEIKTNETILEQYRAQRDALEQTLAEKVRLGQIEMYSQDWYDMVNAIYDVDDAIIDTQSSIEDLQNSINDLHWDYFDELINRFGYLEDEIGNIVQLLSHDVNGLIKEELSDLTSNNWANDSGLTTLGLYAQQMEEAQYVANQYAEAIKELKEQKAAGRYNDTEYYSKLNELISAQYENIEKYYDARDAIVELNETRVDAIKDGIQKEIDAYEELINKKKEELDVQKEAHDFQNEIAEKEKDVASLKKQLAAMSGDTTAATTAKRKQLEAELLDAQKALEESYYDHSITSRQDALDKEFSSFEEEKNKEIENWEEYLKNVDTVVADSLNYVKGQTESIYSTLTGLGQQYGLSLSENITTPWSEGSIAVDNYSTKFETACSSWTTQLDNIASHWKTVQAEAEAAAASQLKALNQQVTDTQGAGTNSNPPTSNNNIQQQQNPVEQPKPAAKAITVGGKINAGSARIYANSYGGGGGRQYFASDPIYTVLKEQNGYLLVRHHSLSSGHTGWFKKSDVKAYAKGTLGTKKNEFSLIDELGDELVLRAGADGKLSYLTKGTGVVPADITEKIIDIATDPIGTLSDMMPKTQLPSVETKDFNFEFNFDSLLHVDNASQDSIPALKKMIRSEFNQMLSGVNSKLKRA